METKTKSCYANSASKQISYPCPLSLLPALTACSPNSETGKYFSRKPVKKSWAISPYCPYWGGGWRTLYLVLVLVFPIYLYTWIGEEEKEGKLVKERCLVSNRSCAHIGEHAALPMAPAHMRPGTHSTASPARRAPLFRGDQTCQLQGLQSHVWSGVLSIPSLQFLPPSRLITVHRDPSIPPPLI